MTVAFPPKSTAVRSNSIRTPISDRKLAANRLNALKSTGPRSISCKQKAAQNSYKHGLRLTRLWH